MLEEYRERIVGRIEELQADEVFNLRDLLGDEWPQNPGNARSLGREFRQGLHIFPTVADEGKDDENLRLYRRKARA